VIGTGDTALTYACENGHTDVADLLLQYNAQLEHESEGGRTPLMKVRKYILTILSWTVLWIRIRKDPKLEAVDSAPGSKLYFNLIKIIIKKLPVH
jgi:ankyrin repeat protein